MENTTRTCEYMWMSSLILLKISILHRTHCEVMDGSHSRSRSKLKVVKWGFKKWNQHILMYIYAKQCEILQKNRWKSSNGQNHCFCNGKSAPRCWKHGKLGKLKRKLLKIFKYYTISRVPPLESWRPEVSENVVVFARGSFLSEVIGCQSLVIFQFFSKAKCGVTKKRHGHNFDFSGLKRIAGVVHPISYSTYSFQARKIKIVAVIFFCDAS